MSFGTDTGGPAFPTEAANHYSGIAASPGMTLRDYFAAKAMQGCATRGLPDGLPFDEVASDCYALADAMLKARES